jgi:F-type H+-transporting ATPase subunit gamma
MAGLKEIRRRIKSVQNTQKITRAMKLVSAAKLRKAQESLLSFREYASGLSAVLGELQGEIAGQELVHPLFEKRASVKRTLLVVIGASKGLCGPYNSNLNKQVMASIRAEKAENPGVEFGGLLLGRKPEEYFKRTDLPFDEAFPELPNDALDWPLEQIAQGMETEFTEGRADRVLLIYTKFKSAMSTKVTAEQLLPLDPAATIASGVRPGVGLTLFEPSPEAVFTALIPMVVRARLRQAALESVASEHGARMSAMEAATKNARDLLDRLTLTRNKLRQAGITGEILDIIGGAAGVS